MKEPRIILAVETSTRSGSAALLARGREPVLAALAGGGSHGGDLASSLKRLLDGLGAEPSAVDLFAAGLGPGSYTGIRVAAATAFGFSIGAGCPLLGVSSFAARAAGAGREGETVMVFADAGAEKCYYAAFRIRGGLADEVIPHSVDSWKDAASRIAPGWVASGPGAVRAVSLARKAVTLRDGGPPNAVEVGRLAVRVFLSRGPTDPGDFRPLYLRRSSAEINWESRRKRT